MSRPDKVLNLLGLAAKGRNVVSGEFAVEKAVKSGQAYLVITAGDASENAKKNYRNLCEYYEVDLKTYSDKDGLGRAIGKEQRVAVAVTDPGLARSLENQISNTEVEYGEN
ncbi:MAG: ribosomal L7Ae/L30e/S12e/Gadd45 family protein [Lachnospiraceae bacterium]|nr:ribosomal L7Ae/L30e/S12e/Gadd45 family protein [Lachnospiraceae bacterium]